MSGLCGSVDVMSSNVCTVWNRRPGDVGLYFLIGISTDPCQRPTPKPPTAKFENRQLPIPNFQLSNSQLGNWEFRFGSSPIWESAFWSLVVVLSALEELGDLLPLAQLHVRLLPVGPLPHEPALAL